MITFIMVCAYIGICDVASIFLSYSPAAKEKSWFTLLLFGIGIVQTANFVLVTKISTDQKQLFDYCLVWESLAAISWFVLPALFFDVKATPISIIGACVMVAGIVLIRLGTN